MARRHKGFLVNEVGVNAEIAINIPVVPTGDYKKTHKNKKPFCLPDRENWFSELWSTCCLRVKETSLFLEISSDRLKNAEDEEEPISDKVHIFDYYHL